MVGLAGKEAVARLATLTVASVLMAAGKNWRFKWGQKTHEEGVCGTNIPRVLHGQFHGEVECEAIYVTDDNWAPLVSIGNLDQVYTVVSADSDTSATPGTKVQTANIKTLEFERQGPANADGVVKATLKATMVGYPTVV
jgi:hypothetical protein